MRLSSRYLRFGLGIAMLAALYLALNLRTLGWPFGIVDTPIVLAQAILYSSWQYFSQPDAYTFLSPNNFTPLVPLSWDFDVSLFGISEQAARIHQLVVHALMLVLFACAVKQLTRSVSATVLFTFAAMNVPATYALLDTLVNRHYIEGMIFALCSFLAFCRYDTARHPGWLALSVSCYAVAALAKEVYLPLPGLLFFLLAGSFKQRVLTIVPFAVVLGAYLALRFYMIGGSGGYSGLGAASYLLQDPSALGALLLRIASGLLSAPLVSLALVASTAAMLFFTVWRGDNRQRAAIAVTLFGVAAPLVTLLPLIDAGFEVSRWVFVPAMVMLLYLAWCCARTHRPAIVAVVYLLVFCSGALASYQRLTSEAPFFVRGEGRNYQALLNSQPDSYVVYSGFSQLASENYSVWAHLAKIRSGRWGALPIAHPGQAPYHSLENRERITIGRKAKQPGFLASDKPLLPDAVAQVSQRAQGGFLSVAFREDVVAQRCSVYLFTAYNGFVVPLPGCGQWQILRRDLVFQLRKAGMPLEQTQVAFWSDDDADPWRSEAYSLNQLIQRAQSSDD